MLNKKYICAIMALTIAAGVCACSSKDSEETTTAASTTAAEATTTEASKAEGDEEEEVFYEDEDDEAVGFGNVSSDSERVIARTLEGTGEEILGTTKWHLESENENTTGWICWDFVNDETKELIGTCFGFFEDGDPIPFYIVDLDNDGVHELITECTFGGDGAERVFIFRNNNGVIEYGDFDSESFFADNELGSDAEMAYSVTFDKASGMPMLVHNYEGTGIYIDYKYYTYQKYEGYVD